MTAANTQGPFPEPDGEVTSGPLTGSAQPRGRRVLSGGSSGSESGYAANEQESADDREALVFALEFAPLEQERRERILAKCDAADSDAANVHPPEPDSGWERAAALSDEQQAALSQPDRSTYCKARQGKHFHDDERTDLIHPADEPDQTPTVRHWWRCRICGLGTWWW